MVVVKLMGGLGNQMFQYACGRRLAHARSTSLKLDISDLGAPNERTFALCSLKISGEIASNADIKRFKSSGFLRRLLRRGGIVKRSHRERNIVREQSFHFDESILSLPDNVYLEGYWQSERYFKDIESLIRREFAVMHPPVGKNAMTAETIAASNAVAVHVRRGDYVSNPKTSQVHGVCTPDYYERAAKRIVQSTFNPHFFVFSDDPKWVRANFRLGHEMTHVDQNSSETGHEDLRLMSLCKHHIIANSSFSWWGAWLSTYPEKIVIAPARWFNDYSADTRDLLPPSWTAL